MYYVMLPVAMLYHLEGAISSFKGKHQMFFIQSDSTNLHKFNDWKYDFL